MMMPRAPLPERRRRGRSLMIGHLASEMECRYESRLSGSHACERRAIVFYRPKGRQAEAVGYRLAEGFHILHRTPFTQPMPEGPQPPTYLHALLKQAAADLPYTMEVWYPNEKILNVQWDTDDRIRLISFRPGAWEAKLAA